MLILPVTYFAGFAVKRSLIFDGAAENLNRTFGTATDSKIWTFATWLKRGAIGGVGMPLLSNLSNSWDIVFGGSTWTGAAANALGIMSNAMTTNVSTSATYTSTTDWMHVVFAIDTTQATAANRVRIYVNGTEVTYSNINHPTQNTTPGINDTSAHRLGSYGGGGTYFFNGQLADTYFIDGQALAPSNFITGTPGSPKKYTGTFGVNGFWLTYFDNASTTTLGEDDAGGDPGEATGGNDWTLNSMDTGNSSTDVPV